MKNILVPLGLSENSVSIARLQYVIDFAKELGGTVYAVEVFKQLPRSGSLPSVNKTLKGISANTIEEKLTVVDKKGVDVIPLPLENDLLEAIPEFNLKHSIDLIVLGAESDDIKNPYFLGETSGSLLKKTEIPVLIIPENYVFKPIAKVLMAIKSGIIKKQNTLSPIIEILNTFSPEMKLLQVKTSDFLPEDMEFKKDLATLISSYKSSENATLFQGVLEHLNENNPDLLCVLRRNRGFFGKLWEDNKVLKKDFESRIPLLVLKGATY
ncbi:Nucleotide-binding universal stress protein, UspA family [Aquimarina amphilecti]|uniref:Nucleotide-binding universal stress protein, UspA family n=1 Tax=Aquimarina amphilecti TaxID=1038014 RepID=A0A1H7KA95_AQUAM|nr:universal stress protein [Aquimarina amphilecti]SEK83430.1 Nucleotide-binding universal stress protein, UspA family [Aquimarina amphilecti]